MNLQIDIALEKVLHFINANNNFLLTAHINSDGDAIASVLAISCFFEKLNKSFEIIFHDVQIDAKYSFLQNWDKIRSFSSKEHKKKFTTAIILDAPGRDRIGDVAALLPDPKNVLKIDHHPSEDDFCDADWVDIEMSSTASMIYEIINRSNVGIGLSIAECIYTGIIYDTGRLSYSNTRARDLQICATLVAKGVKPSKITNALFFNNSVKAMQIIGRGLTSIKQYLKQQVTIITLSYNDLENIDQSEIEELANHSVSVAGTEVGVFIREVEPGFFKISLRSREKVNVRDIAAQLDGGGHIRASGCRYKGTIVELRKILLNLIDKQL